MLDCFGIYRAVRDDTGRIVDFVVEYVNDAACANNQLAREAQLGRRLLELLPGHLATDLLQAYRRVVETGEPFLRQSLRYTDRYAGVEAQRIFDIRAVRLGDGMAVSWRDVSDATAARREFEALVSNAPDVIARFDPELRHRYVNPAGERVAGLSMAELVGRTNREVGQPEEFVVAWETAIRRVFETGLELVEEYSFESREGMGYYQTRFVPERDAAGRIASVLSVSRDMTAQRRAEALARHAQRLDMAGKLAGGVAHEINNQLTAVLGFQSLAIREASLSEAVRQDVLLAHQAAERAAAITRQLLAFGRRQVLRPATFELAELLEESDVMLRRLLGDTVLVRIDTREAGGARVHMDRDQLSQVLLNLAINARDAMPGEGTLEVELAAAELTAAQITAWTGRAARAGRYARLRIRDSGHGMSADVAAHAFEPFFTTKPVGKGTGLGLAVVYGIIDQSGGYIWLESEPGAGTTVTLVLPLASTGAPAGAPGPSGPTPASGSRASQGAILVVDDEPAVRSIAARILSEEGWRVHTAENGRAALEILARDAGVVAVLTDLMMPVMNGVELGRRVAQDRPRPVVFMSAYPVQELEDRSLLHHGAAFVQKPFTPDELVLALRAAMAAAQ